MVDIASRTLKRSTVLGLKRFRCWSFLFRLSFVIRNWSLLVLGRLEEQSLQCSCRFAPLDQFRACSFIVRFVSPVGLMGTTGHDRLVLFFYRNEFLRVPFANQHAIG